MNPTTTNKHTPQNILNWSFDSDFNLLTVGLIGYDGSVTRRVKVNSNGELALPTGASTSDNQTNGTQQTKIKETAPTDATKNNSETDLSYDGDGNLQYIDETIGATVYRTTLTYTAGVLTNVSPAVAQ